ncbi:hypothetical protein NDU88_002524 [Pleurodeles waltl]|uniref:Uncharacterized protein n=1 Tax=Pleurodeles waltl TaxID=8319 RepID=A0AAV7NDZ2_PLEWA|nr:hypothetical protein NDU88_002524 [Pleurodeles waltl]
MWVRRAGLSPTRRHIHTRHTEGCHPPSLTAAPSPLWLSIMEACPIQQSAVLLCLCQSSLSSLLPPSLSGTALDMLCPPGQHGLLYIDRHSHPIDTGSRKYGSPAGALKMAHTPTPQAPGCRGSLPGLRVVPHHQGRSCPLITADEPLLLPFGPLHVSTTGVHGLGVQCC